MSKSRSRFLGILLVLLVVASLCGVWYFARRSRMRVIRVTPEISLRLAGVLTRSSREFALSDGSPSVPGKVFTWKIAQYLIKYLPDWARITKFSTIDTSSLGADQVRLVYFVDYPKQWNSTKVDFGIEMDLINAFAGIMDWGRLKISEGSFGRKKLIGFNVGFVGSGIDKGGFPEDFKKLAYLTLDFEVPVFCKELNVEFGEEPLQGTGGGLFRVEKTQTVDNPLYRRVVPLSNPVTLPASKRVGDVEVTLNGVVARVAGGSQLKATDTAAGINFEYEKDRPILNGDLLMLDHFPLGVANDPAGYSSAVVMTVKEKGRITTEWQATNMHVTYGADNIPIDGFQRSSFVQTGSVTSFPCDLAGYPGPLKITAQLKHVANLLPDEEVMLDLPLPAAGELVTYNTDLPLWSKTLKLFAVRYNSTEMPAGALPSALWETVYFRPAEGPLGCLQVLSDGNEKLTDMALWGTDGASFDLDRFTASSSGRFANYHNLWGTAYDGVGERPFNYEDYTTLSLTMRDGRTSPALFEFVVTPQIATGSDGGRGGGGAIGNDVRSGVDFGLGGGVAVGYV